MKKQIIYYLFILAITFACNPQTENLEDKASIDCISDDKMLIGTWQSSNFWDSYTEIEIADSLRCYVNHGAYIGPTRAEEYVVKNDTLFRIETGQKYQICIKDSSSVSLMDRLGHKYEWKRFETTNKISDWSLDQDSIFDAEFLTREKEFQK